MNVEWMKTNCVPCAVCGCLGNNSCGHDCLDLDKGCTLDRGEICPCCRSLKRNKQSCLSEPRFSEIDITRAVNEECTCGGGGPDDSHTCQACKVYHRLVTHGKT